MDLSSYWRELLFSNKEEVLDIRFYVSQVTTYLACPKAYIFWRGKLGLERDGDYLFCHDMLLIDEHGMQLKVMLNPGLNSFQMGSVTEGMFIRFQKAMRIPYCDKYILVLFEWSPCDSFYLQFIGRHHLEQYRNQDESLSNSDNDLLCHWTCSHFITTNKVPMRTKPAIPVLSYDSDHHNLRNLDLSWNNLLRMWPLVLRVLAKSKKRLIIQQDNHRKPWMTLCNLLVADTSAYCVLTVWDDAVDTITQSVKEGDIIVLDGRYKVGRYRPANQKMLYRLAPKVRDKALSPTEIEIKLNNNDMDRVYLIHSAAMCNAIPEPMWNFMTTKCLVEEIHANRQLIDYVGMVIQHGRWEREQCQNQFNKFTGQFWVRVWLLLKDHSSDLLVGVKMYVDGSRWHSMECAIPGETVAITNLLYVQDKNGCFSHLECSNESEVFVGEEADDSRFGDCNVVLDYRKAIYSNSSQWVNVLREKGGFGGNLHLHDKIQVSLFTTGFVIHNKDDLVSSLSNLMFKSSRRVLLKAFVGEITYYSISSSGNSVIDSVEGVTRHTCSEKFFSPLPLSVSFFKSIEGMSKHSLMEALKYHCFLKRGLINQDHQQSAIRGEDVAMIKLTLDDCMVNVQCHLSTLTSLEYIRGSTKDEKVVLCVDLFRFMSYDVCTEPWFGVEAVLQSVLSPDVEILDSESPISSDELVTTFDLASNLL